MRASSCIVPGCFRGAEIEPGTFHHFIPRQLHSSDPESDVKAKGDRSPSVSDPRPTPLGANVRRSDVTAAPTGPQAEADGRLNANAGSPACA